MLEEQQKFTPVSYAESAEHVTMYLRCVIQQILYQRQFFPPTDFQAIREFGDPHLVECHNPVAVNYLKPIFSAFDISIDLEDLGRVRFFSYDRKIRQIAETWEFRIKYEDRNKVATKDKPTLQAEIREALREFTASVASSINTLPRIDPYRYEIGAGQYKNVIGAATARHPQFELNNNEELEVLELLKFSTSLHEVNSQVVYRKTVDRPGNGEATHDS